MHAQWHVIWPCTQTGCQNAHVQRNVREQVHADNLCSEATCTMRVTFTSIISLSPMHKINQTNQGVGEQSEPHSLYYSKPIVVSPLYLTGCHELNDRCYVGTAQRILHVFHEEIQVFYETTWNLVIKICTSILHKITNTRRVLLKGLIDSKGEEGM